MDELYLLSLTPVSLNVTWRAYPRNDIRQISCSLRQQPSFMLNRIEIVQTRMQTLADFCFSYSRAPLTLGHGSSISILPKPRAALASLLEHHDYGITKPDHNLPL